MSRLTIVIVAILGAASLSAQTVPKMRTRMLTSLTNTEIEQYLERNDVIFVPVGTVEPHAGLPLDCEYVGPLAYATLFAEKVDGLVLPGLVYFFPDATIVGRGAVHVTPSEGTAYLMAIAHSLLRQGFRRQVYITGHLPSFQTLSPLVRQFFDETGAPILFLESSAFRRPGTGPGLPNFGDFTTMLIGAYGIVGRLQDVPVNLSQDAPPHPANPGLDTLFALGPQSGTIGFYMVDPTDHMGPARPITAEQRDALATRGMAMYREAVEAVDIAGILQAMRDHDRFTQERILPGHGWMFPKP